MKKTFHIEIHLDGGSGAGVSIKPVAFIVIQGEKVKLLPVEHNCTIDRIFDYMPELCEKAENMMNKMINKNKKEEKIKIKKPHVKKVNMNYQYDYNRKVDE